MKLYLVILFSLVAFSCFSQRICEIGDYDFILNKIKGVDELKFSKIILSDSIKKITNVEYNFDESYRMIRANFIGRGTVFNKLECFPCYKRNNLEYTYIEKDSTTDIVEIKVKDSIEQVLLKYNKERTLMEINSDFIKVKLTYQNGKIKTIKRNNYLFTYSWKGNLLSKISIDSNGYTPTEIITFNYYKGKIKTVKYSYLSKGECFEKYNLRYYYNEKKVSRIKFNHNKITRKSFLYVYDYSDSIKLKVYKTKSINDYIWHYEYYY